MLVDDIIPYGSLAERDELLMLSNLISGNGDEFAVEVQELNLPEATCVRIPSPTNEDDEQSSGNQRYNKVTMEEMKPFIMDNRNNSTNYKTKSDIKMFVRNISPRAIMAMWLSLL